MKKLIEKFCTVMACLCCVLACGALLSGCDDTKPTDWTVGAETTWEIWAEGTIVSMTDVVASDYTEYKFDTGRAVNIRHIQNPGLISNGQKGILYRHMALSPNDKEAWFQWIKDGSYVREEIYHNISTTKTDKDIDESLGIQILAMKDIIKIQEDGLREQNIMLKEKKTPDQWRNAESIRNLDANKIVLIVLEDGIITTGFVTYDRLWKLGTNLNDYKGGMTINVSKWKRLNLE